MAEGGTRAKTTSLDVCTMSGGMLCSSKSASPFRDNQAEEVYLKATVNYNLEGEEEPGV